MNNNISCWHVSSVSNQGIDATWYLDLAMSSVKQTSPWKSMVGEYESFKNCFTDVQSVCPKQLFVPARFINYFHFNTVIVPQHLILSVHFFAQENVRTILTCAASCKYIEYLMGCIFWQRKEKQLMVLQRLQIQGKLNTTTVV